MPASPGFYSLSFVGLLQMEMSTMTSDEVYDTSKILNSCNSRLGSQSLNARFAHGACSVLPKKAGLLSNVTRTGS